MRETLSAKQNKTLEMIMKDFYPKPENNNNNHFYDVVQDTLNALNEEKIAFVYVKDQVNIIKSLRPDIKVHFNKRDRFFTLTVPDYDIKVERK